MIGEVNINLIVSGLTLIGIIIAVYKSIHKPDEDADKRIALLKDQLISERKTTDMAIQTTQNCLHSLEKEVAGHRTEVVNMGKELVRLATIIEERLPKQ
jgi:hypothetical protein